MKKITSFLVLLAAVLLTLPAQAFTWNWVEHETPSFFDQKKAPMKVFLQNDVTPVQESAIEAPQGIAPVAKQTRRAAIASVDALVGDYTWDYKTSSTRAADVSTITPTAGSAHVTIAKGTADGTIVISGMFPNDITASVDISTGDISIARQAAGTNSNYGAYDIRNMYYNADAETPGWYVGTKIPATVGDDGVITFSTTMWIQRVLTEGDYAGASLTPYYLPGSTLTPSEPLTVVTPPDAVAAAAEEYTLTYLATADATERSSIPIKIAVDGSDVYVQGVSYYLPEAWVKGTQAGNTITFPGKQYMGQYGTYGSSFFFYNGETVFTYDVETNTFSATGQVYGVLADKYYDGNYFNPVLKKVVEVAATPATPSITKLANGNYGYYFTFNIPTVDTEGNGLVTSKLTYKIYTDVNHEISVLTFTPTTHTKLTAEMSEFPYGFTENYDFYTDQIYLNNLFSTTWHQIGIQTIYTGGGETHESEIGWYKIKEYPSAKDIEVTPDPGTDISAAIATALGTEGDWAKNVTITLAEGGNYTITNAIEADGSVIINGNGATIDASGLEGNFIQRKTEPAEWTEANVAITGVTVKGLKKALFYSGFKKYFGDVTIDNCVVEQAADATTFDYTKGSTAVNFTVTNSTFYAPAATTKQFYSSQGGQKTTEYSAEAIETFTFTNNTMYNLATGKNFFSHRQSNQTWLKYVVKNNVFVNCGKSGQVIKGMNGGQSGMNPTWDIDGNAFNFEVTEGEGDAAKMTDTSASEDTGDAEEPVKNSVAGIVTFPNVAEGKFDGKFRLAEGATAPVSLGDPRWALKIIAPVTITPHTPVKAKASDYAEIIQTNDLTKKWSDGSWTLTDEAKTWVVYNYDGATEGDIQKTNRNSVWFDFESEYEGCDTMIVTSEAKGWGGQFYAVSKTNGNDGLMIVGKTRYPEFNITGTEKAKFYFYGSAGTAGYAQIEVYEEGATEPVQKKTGDIALTKKTWDKSTLLIVDGLDKEKNYKIVARSVDAEGAYEGGDIVLQVVKLYPENLPAKVRPVDIEVSPASGDIAAAVTEAKATVPVVGNITINLTEGATYTVASTIEAPAGITINGNGATIDASALTTPFIQLSATPSGEQNAKEAYLSDGISIKDVTITGVKYQLIYGNKVKALLAKVEIENSVIAVDGTAKKTVIDFNGGGNASEVVISSSTIYANPALAQAGGLFSSQSGHGSIQDLGSEKQLLAITNSTIYNISKGANTCSQRRNNTAGMEYKVENSVIVNSGKSGQFVVGLNGGSANAAQTYTINNNAFNFEVTEGEPPVTSLTDVSDAEQKKVQEKIAEAQLNSVAGVVAFADAANGDFTLGACPAKDASIGDPRWLPAYSTSLNIEKLVLEEGKKADIKSILEEHNIQFADINELDSLNDDKGMLRNEAYLGLKVKTADAYIKVLVKKGQVLNVKLGYIADDVNVSINGTVDESKKIAQKKDLSSTVFTLAAAEADQEVTFTTTTKSTVVFKQIMIGEDIADVTLPVQTKFEITKAEGITNGDIAFAATTLTNTKAPFMVEKGDEVTVTATPAEGYELEAITVKGVTSNEVITVTEGKFTMPADAVTVSATFKEKQGDGIATIKAEALENAVIYNLKGERVEKTQAQGGVFIVNGKKVAIK